VPLQVDASEADQVDRYLKRANKDTRYKQTVVELAGTVESAVKQNNTIDMYEEYFSDYSLGTCVSLAVCVYLCVCLYLRVCLCLCLCVCVHARICVSVPVLACGGGADSRVCVAARGLAALSSRPTL